MTEATDEQDFPKLVLASGEGEGLADGDIVTIAGFYAGPEFKTLQKYRVERIP